MFRKFSSKNMDYPLAIGGDMKTNDPRVLRAKKLRLEYELLKMRTENENGIRRSYLLAKSNLAFFQSEQILNPHRSCFEPETEPVIFLNEIKMNGINAFKFFVFFSFCNVVAETIERVFQLSGGNANCIWPGYLAGLFGRGQTLTIN